MLNRSIFVYSKYRRKHYLIKNIAKNNDINKNNFTFIYSSNNKVKFNNEENKLIKQIIKLLKIYF